METTTCQICGRPIKANTGTIAHHGYKRPGGGWQTSSCIGAKHLPYEVSCDFIAVAITRIEAYLKMQTERLSDFKANPPATIEETRFIGYRSVTVKAERPEGFDPVTCYRTHRSGAYDTLFFHRIYEIEGFIKHAEADIVYLTQRLADWKAPVTES